MISQNRKNYSGLTGRVAEVRFARAANSLGLQVAKASREDDMHLHIDYWMTHKGKKGRWGVDVKGNNMPDEIWCEFKNVRGNPGWMYGGAQIIAFDMPEEGGFSVVDREDLKTFCEENVQDVLVTNKADSYLKKYQRRDRLDIITSLKLPDLRRLKTYRVWKYFTDY